MGGTLTAGDPQAKVSQTQEGPGFLCPQPGGTIKGRWIDFTILLHKNKNFYPCENTINNI